MLVSLTHYFFQCAVHAHILFISFQCYACTCSFLFLFRKRLPQLILIFVFLILTILLMRGEFNITLHVTPETDKTSVANSDKVCNHEYEIRQTNVLEYQVQLSNNSEYQGKQNNISKYQIQQNNISEYQLQQSSDKFTEIQHIAFLKVHKAASSTVQNILYRFGLKRKLSIVLPIGSHYISKKKEKNYHQVLPPYDNITGKHDILCNHAVFNQTKFKKLLHSDAVYIAIVREPLHLFISSALYYRYVWPNRYLTKIGEKNFIHDLIHKPAKYEPQNMKDSRTFNNMATDFGFEINNINSVAKLKESDISLFISNLKNAFHFVIIVEYFDESLVMLKRLLNWSLKDILYIKQNEFKQSNRSKSINVTVTDEDKRVFRNRNRLDYAIYETFLDLFLKRMSKETDLLAEVSEFRNNLKIVRAFCEKSHPKRKKKDLIFPSTKWTASFTVERQDCVLMKTGELTFWQKLKQKHKLRLQEIR